MRFTDLILGALAATSVSAHPGHDHKAEAAERRDFFAGGANNGRRDLSHCAAKIKERGIDARAAKRRADLAKKTMTKRGIKARDLDELLNVSHLSSEEYDLSTEMSTLFSGNNSCVLSPETTEGPYYVAGEYVRQDINDGEAGVPLVMDAQVLDINTCEPIPDVYVEVWHCNAVGVYSGVVAGGNGDGSASNLDTTFHRGLQLSDSDGAVSFDSMFPGHYQGRTTHIHVMVHVGAEERENGTVLSTTTSHVGQMFFDQDLIHEVETASAYASNTQALTLNNEDFILEEEAATSDPFMEYVWLGEEIQDGLLAWLAFGVDMDAVREISNAATLTEEGGVANENAGMGGGPPGGFMPPKKD